MGAPELHARRLRLAVRRRMATLGSADRRLCIQSQQNKAWARAFARFFSLQGSGR